MSQAEDLASVRRAGELIVAIQDALDRGVIHRNKAGVILPTTKEVVACILDEGGVAVENPPASER